MGMKLRIYLICFAYFFISACNIQDLRPSGSGSGNESVAQLEQQANTAYQNEDWQTAENLYTELTRQDAANAEHWFRLGNIYSVTGNLDMAITAYRNALSRNNGYSKAWNNLGFVYLRQATDTFKDMLQHTDKNDPLNQRAIHVINSVGDLMVSGFDKNAPD